MSRYWTIARLVLAVLSSSVTATPEAKAAEVPASHSTNSPPENHVPLAAPSSPATIGYVDDSTNALNAALQPLIAAKSGSNDLAAATNQLNAAALNSGIIPLPRLAGITGAQLESNAWFLATNGAPVFTNSASLWVDSNGNDSIGRRGISELPFGSLHAALAAALPRDTVYINGVIDEQFNQIVVPDSVSIRGLAQTATVITSYTNANHAAFVPGNNSVIENLTLIGTNGFEFTIGKGGTDYGFTNVVFRNCTVIGDSDCFYFAGSAPTHLTIDSCRLNSHWDNIAMYNSSVHVVILNSVLNVSAGQWTNQITGANGLRADLGQLTAQNCRVSVSGSLIGNHATKSGNGGPPDSANWMHLVNCVLDASGTNSYDVLNNWFYDELDLETFYLIPISVANTIRADGRSLSLGLGRYAVPDRISFIGGLPPGAPELSTLVANSNSASWTDASQELYLNDGFLTGTSVAGGTVAGVTNGGGTFNSGAPPGFPDSGWLQLYNSADIASAGYIRYAASDAANIPWQNSVIVAADLVLTGQDFTNSQYLVGLVSSAAAAALAPDAICWFNDPYLSPYWIAACGSGNSYSYKTSQVVSAVNTRYSLGIRGDTNAVNFCTNGVVCFSITTDLPVGKPLELIARTRHFGDLPGSGTSNSLWIDSIKARIR